MIVSVAPLLKQPLGTHVPFSFAEDPIDPRGENAELHDAGFDSVKADITATHTNPGAYLEGHVVAGAQEPCSRCLRPARVLVDATFAEQYYATIAVVGGEQLAAAPLDARTIGSDFRIDLSPLVREELILASPVAPLCRPDCPGLCLTCGDDLNDRPHEHEEELDERWAVLGQLREFHAERD
ncbi:hypothetical protein BH18CHL2_BH18CHL2_11370 [soil metagenome]